MLRERYAEITAMDRAIGTTAESLEGQGLRENTLLWYCGDNGTPPTAPLTSPFAGQKATSMRAAFGCPGFEWPARITRPRVSE